MKLTNTLGLAIAKKLSGPRRKPGVVIPAWDGTPRNSDVALLGDSFVANSYSAGSGWENYGFLKTVIRRAGARLRSAVALLFGVGGDTTVMAEVRVPQVIASGAGWVFVHCSTNDPTADMAADDSIASLKRMKQAFYDNKIVAVFWTAGPRGNDTYPDKRLTGTRLATAQAIRSRIKSELPGVGCYVVDDYDTLLKPGTVSDIIDALSHDGLHPNTYGATLKGEIGGQRIIQLAAAKKVISTAERPWSANDPKGSASSNLLMAGTGGAPGTGGTGPMADGYTGTNATGTANVTRTYSKVDKDGLTWQRVVLGGAAATANAAVDVMRQTGLHTKVTPGLEYEVVGQYEIAAGAANVLSLQLGYSVTSPTLTETIWDADRYIATTPLSPQAQVGTFQTTSFIMPEGVTALSMRCTCYMGTAGAPAADILLTGLELRPVVR